MAQAKRKPIPEWTAKDAARYIRVPSKTDDKYSRGVLGMVTGSKRYPGAAILGVEAALSTGIGMVRYLGPKSVARLVLLRRPEVVTVDGRVNAWVVGSGIEGTKRTFRERRVLMRAIQTGQPIVIDAGALDLVSKASGRVIITPHARELAMLLIKSEAECVSSYVGVEQLTEEIKSKPAMWSQLAADELGTVVVLKGNHTHITEPKPNSGRRFHTVVKCNATWLATAGSGDVLAGILGALLASHEPLLLRECCEIAATASWLHCSAASSKGLGKPILAGDIAESVGRLILVSPS